MASPSSSQRFNDYLNRLQQEFERQSNAASQTTSRSSRFTSYLGHLKYEFSLLSLEIESLRIERDEYKEQVAEVQAKLQEVCRNFLCERCSKGSTNDPPSFVSSQSKPLIDAPPLSSSALSPWSTDIRGPQSAVVVTNAVQSISLSTSQSQDAILVRPKTITLPSSLQQRSASGVRDSGSKKDTLSITFNHKVDTDLDVEMAHVLPHKKRICFVNFSPDGKYLAAGCHDGRAYVYDTETGSPIFVLRNLLVKQDVVRAVCFNHDGKYLATASSEGGLSIWETGTKYVRNAFKGHTHRICSLSFSPNGRLLVSASYDNTVRLWNMRDGAPMFLTEDNPTFIDDAYYTCAVFSPDGRYVAASHRDGIVRIWDVRTGQLTRRVRAHWHWVGDVAFTPDGKGLVSGSSDKTLKYWDISSLYTARFDSRGELRTETEERVRFSGHKRSVNSVAISPDGKWVASGSRDQSIRIWDTHNAAMQCILNNVHDAVWTVDFSPTGRYLASGGNDGTVRIWRYSLRRRQ